MGRGQPPAPLRHGDAALTAGFRLPDQADLEAHELALVELRTGNVGSALRKLALHGELDLSPPGSGRTWERLRRLAEIAAVDLSLGRLAEGHADALAILAEAELSPIAGGVYGVWAASGHVGCSEALLSGIRHYCSGAGIIDRALVACDAGDEGGAVLVEVELNANGVEIEPGTWPATGMAASQSSSVTFVQARAFRSIGPPGFYSNRPGFWRGSLNVAACWYGGALGLARSALNSAASTSDPYRQYELGALRVTIATMRAVLRSAASETDRASSCCEAGDAQSRALITRHFIYEGCGRVLEHAARIGGTEAATHNPEQSRRMADLPIYLRQHHPGPDMAAVAVFEAEQ